jgi:hypothetical protein
MAMSPELIRAKCLTLGTQTAANAEAVVAAAKLYVEFIGTDEADFANRYSALLAMTTLIPAIRNPLEIVNGAGVLYRYGKGEE